MKFDIYQDSWNQYHWRLPGKDGELIASGESYENKVDCQNAIRLVQGSGSVTVSEVAVK